MGKSIEASTAAAQEGGTTSNVYQQERSFFLRAPLLKTVCRKRQRHNSLINSPSNCGINCSSSGACIAGGYGGPAKCSSARMKAPLLPPSLPEDQAKKTLVLDLDETLVHSSFKPIPDFDFAIQVEMEVEMNRMGFQTVYVLKRPGVEEFLRAMAAQFEVVVFTAGLKQYADAVLNVIDIENCIKYRLYRDSCRLYMGGLVKDLSTLGRDLHKVIIVDNSPHCYLLQPKNAVPIVSFIDDRDDHELLDLIPFLSVIAELDNVTDALGQM